MLLQRAEVTFDSVCGVTKIPHLLIVVANVSVEDRLQDDDDDDDDDGEPWLSYSTLALSLF